MRNALLVIDVQEDFVNKSTKRIPIKIRDFLKTHKFDYVFFFKFVNDKKSNWEKVFKWGKMLKDSETKIVPELKLFLRKNNVFIKNAAFSVFTVKKFNNCLKKNKIKKLFMCGFDTHACVLASALEAFSKGFDVKVIEDLCGASHGESYHKSAINILKVNLGRSTVIKSKNL